MHNFSVPIELNIKYRIVRNINKCYEHKKAVVRKMINTAKCNPMPNVGYNTRNTVCKDEKIKEWKVRLNEMKDNVSVIR